MKKITAKKILSLVLCVLMLSSVLLTSCQEEGEKEVTQIRLSKSVVMAVVCEKLPDAETELAIEEAFNAITKAQFKTQVDIKFFTEETYLQEIVDLMERIKADNKAAEEEKENNQNNKNEETEAVTEEETKENAEYGYAETVYPEFLANQLDILYIGGYEMYNFLCVGDDEGSYLVRLDEDLSTNSKLIKDYIFPEYMKTVQYNGSTYAIPNNAISTEFTYLLVNKELASKYQYSENMKTWKNIVDANNFINDIAKYETSVAPIFGNPEPTNVHFWNFEEYTTLGWYSEKTVDPETGKEIVLAPVIKEYPAFSLNPNEFSVFGAAMPDDSEYGFNLGCGLTLSSSNTYAKQLLEIQKYKDNNLVHATLAADQKFAVGFVKGNEYDIAQYKDEYEVIVCETPRFTSKSVFDNTFGVCSLSKTNVDRNMEIITAINTNPTLKNILQYGIEGVNYEIDPKTGMLSRLNDKYLMDNNKTGNVFIAHPEEGITPQFMEMAKMQNVAAELYPCAGFNKTVYSDDLSADFITKANALSVKYKEKLDACKNLAELEAVLAEFAQDNEVRILQMQWNETEPTPPEDEPDAKVLYSPYALYYKWLEENKFLVGEDG